MNPAATPAEAGDKGQVRAVRALGMRWSRSPFRASLSYAIARVVL